MRVIAGSARSLKLKTLEGIDTRPTTDRIKETLFNMIAPYLYDCEFLDLFAGSGGIGIEALSRGAKEAVFVEKNPKAMECIKENLKFTRLEKKGITLTKDVLNALYQLEGDKVFDYIFMDPPYDRGLEKEVLSKKEFKQGMDGVAIGVKFEFSSSDFSKSKEAKTYKITGVPAMVVVDAEGKELGRTGYVPGRTPVQYVEFFKKYAPKTAEAK